MNKPLKKALFIDRDGTILVEPADEQIDSLEKFAFVPGAISGLKALTGLGFEIVECTHPEARDGYARGLYGRFL